MSTKICRKCEIEKQLSEFSFRKDTNKYSNECKVCSNQRHKELKREKFENYEWKDFSEELECGICKLLEQSTVSPNENTLS